MHEVRGPGLFRDVFTNLHRGLGHPAARSNKISATTGPQHCTLRMQTEGALVPVAKMRTSIDPLT